jgi:hypothetical protein
MVGSGQSRDSGESGTHKCPLAVVGEGEGRARVQGGVGGIGAEGPGAGGGSGCWRRSQGAHWGWARVGEGGGPDHLEGLGHHLLSWGTLLSRVLLGGDPVPGTFL